MVGHIIFLLNALSVIVDMQYIYEHLYSPHPLLGASRYVPGGGRGSSGMSTRSGISDPFTGNVLSSLLVEYCMVNQPCSKATYTFYMLEH